MPFLDNFDDLLALFNPSIRQARRLVNGNPQQAPQQDPIMGPVNDSLDKIQNNLQSGINRWQQAAQNNYPSTADLFGQLQQMQDPSRYMMNDQDIYGQAEAMAGQQYDPLIAQLQSQMGNATTRANRYKGQIGDMYSALEGSYQKDLPQIQQQYAKTKGDTQAHYDQLKNMIQSQYDQSQGDQESMMQRLGIQAAASDSGQSGVLKQMRDRDFYKNMASVNGQTQQDALGQEEQGAINFTNQGAQIARGEGARRQSDLMGQLQDLLNNYEGQIGSQQIAKQNAVNSGVYQLRQQLTDRARNFAQQDFTNYLNTMKIGRQLRNDDWRQSGTKTTSVKSPADVAPFVLGLGLDENQAQNVQDIFLNTIGNDNSILSGMDSGSGTPLTAEAKAKQIVEQGRQQGLSNAEINALQTAALQYFGRR